MEQITDTVRRKLQLLDNTSLNILIAQHFFKYEVISRTTLPKNKNKFTHNIKVDGQEKPLPNYIKDIFRKWLTKIIRQGYNVYVEKHGVLFRAVVNDHEAVDDFERSIAIALLMNLLIKEL